MLSYKEYQQRTRAKRFQDYWDCEIDRAGHKKIVQLYAQVDLRVEERKSATVSKLIEDCELKIWRMSIEQSCFKKKLYVHIIILYRTLVGAVLRFQ